MSTVLTAISNITGEIGTIEKGGTNTFHKYKFVQAADVMYRLQPLLAKHGLLILQSEASRSLISDDLLSIQYEFTLAHKDGEVFGGKLVQTGLSSARNTKGGYDDKAANKCATAAHKYLVINLFKIPTGEFDDADGHQDQASVAVPTAANDNALPSPEPAIDTEPHTIPVTTKPKSNATDWVAWGARFVAGVNTAVDSDELRKWIDRNSATLDDCGQAAPKVFKQITTRIAEAELIIPIIAGFRSATNKEMLSAAWDKHGALIRDLEKSPYDRLAATFEYHTSRLRDSTAA